MEHKLVRPSEEDFGGQVPAKFAAEGTLDGDGLERKFLPASGHIAAAFFAGDHEGLAARRRWEHGNIIGEYKAKMLEICSIPLLQLVTGFSKPLSTALCYEDCYDF